MPETVDACCGTMLLLRFHDQTQDLALPDRSDSIFRVGTVLYCIVLYCIVLYNTVRGLYRIEHRTHGRVALTRVIRRCRAVFIFRFLPPGLQGHSKMDEETAAAVSTKGRERRKQFSVLLEEHTN